MYTGRITCRTRVRIGGGGLEMDGVCSTGTVWILIVNLLSSLILLGPPVSPTCLQSGICVRTGGGRELGVIREIYSYFLLNVSLLP